MELTSVFALSEFDGAGLHSIGYSRETGPRKILFVTCGGYCSDFTSAHIILDEHP